VRDVRYRMRSEAYSSERALERSLVDGRWSIPTCAMTHAPPPPPDHPHPMHTPPPCNRPCGLPELQGLDLKGMKMLQRMRVLEDKGQAFAEVELRELPIIGERGVVW
jgi:hypothetical protein